jgi:hypothetical protein
MKRIPVDFPAIAESAGIRRGKIAYSPVFRSWCVFAADEPRVCVIEAPPGTVRVEDGHWVVNEDLDDDDEQYSAYAR